jgi:hypothetical protein
MWTLISKDVNVFAHSLEAEMHLANGADGIR